MKQTFRRDESGTAVRRPVRWWPAALILVLVGLRVAWVWIVESTHRQGQVLATAFTLVLGFLLLVVWLLLFSRIAWKRRLVYLSGVALVGMLGWAVFEVRGVSGDLAPELAWRWSPRPGELPPTRPGTDRAADADAAALPFDFPQFLGPSRDGRIEGPALDRNALEAAPPALWRQPIGAGWSGFAVAGPFAVTQEQRGADEFVSCYDLTTGRLRWSHADPTRFDNPMGGTGPRATPAIAGDRVYALGATGILNVLELRSGRSVWTRNVLDDVGAEVPTYGMSASPLILGDWVVVSTGGRDGNSIVAYERKSGEVVWSGGDAPSGYSSPLVGDLAGVRQILIFDGRSLTSYRPGSGEVLWDHPWPGGSEHVSQPVVLPGDRVFLSSGYGVGGKLFRVKREELGESLAVELIWETRGLKAKFTNVVHDDGFLYGLDDGILVCLEVESGKRCWKRGRFGHGQVLLVADLLLVLGEKGEVALVEATPEAYRELGRFQALEGKTWNHPALAGPYLLVRNDREAACYQLGLRRTDG